MNRSFIRHYVNIMLTSHNETNHNGNNCTVKIFCSENLLTFIFANYQFWKLRLFLDLEFCHATKASTLLHSYLLNICVCSFLENIYFLIILWLARSLSWPYICKKIISVDDNIFETLFLNLDRLFIYLFNCHRQELAELMCRIETVFKWNVN